MNELIKDFAPGLGGANRHRGLALGADNELTLVETDAVQQSDEFLAASRYRMEEMDRERRIFSEKALVSYALGVGQGGRHEKELAQMREQAADLGYLNMPASTVVPGHRESLLGFEVARRLGNGDVWGTAQRVIEQLPEEQREEWSKRLHSCKTRRDGEIVLGEAFTASARHRHAELTAREDEYKRASEAFEKELSTVLANAATNDVALDAKTFQQAVHFQWDAEALSKNLDMARAAMRYVFSLRREGMNADKWQQRVEAEEARLRREDETAIANGQWWQPYTRLSDEPVDYRARAVAALSESFNFDREEVLHLTRLLEEGGKLNEHALAIFLLAVNNMAEDEQSADSEFFRNFLTRFGDVVTRTADEAGRWDAKLASWGLDLHEPRASYNPAVIGSLHVPSASRMRTIRSAYNPNVEKLRAALANVEDVRLTSSPRANLLESSISDLGSIVGDTAPMMLVSALSGGGGGALAALGGFAASTATLAPALVNRSIGQKYLEGAANPELAGYVEGIWNASAESLFGLPRRALPLYARYVDRAALKARSIPGVARLFGVTQGHAMNRYALGVLAESGGEFLVEPIIAASGTWLTTEGLQMLGVNLDDVEYNPLAETRALWNDESQRYATVAFCAAMGLFGLPANRRAAREFATNQRMMLKVGLKKETAARISSAHNSGLITTEEAEVQMRDAFREEVIHGNPNEVLKRLQEEKEITLSEVEAATLAQGNLHKAALKLLGVLERERRGDKNVLRIVDKVKLAQDQAKWEKDENGNLIEPKGYEVPIEEVEYTDDELIAFMRYGLKEKQLTLMKHLRSAALALDAAGKLNAREDSGVNVFALSSELMKTEEGKALMDEAAAQAHFKGAMTPRILGTISSAAQVEMLKGASALVKSDSGGHLPSSALSALSGVASAWGERVDFAASQGEQVDGTNAFRMNGEKGVSDILFNAGHATLPEIAEETMESMLYRAAYDAGGVDANGSYNATGREFLRGVAAGLQAVREQVQTMTGIDIMPGLDMKKAEEPMHVIEHFSHFARSDFYRNADRYELSEEALRNVQFVDAALLSADMLKRADNGWQQFIKSDAGKAWMEQGGTLQGLLRNAGLAVASVYQEAYVTEENALVAAEAAASFGGLSIADVMELEEQVKLEDAEREAAASPSVPAPPEVTVEGVDVLPSDGSEAASFTQDGEFSVPGGSQMLISPEGLGRGLVNGVYAPNGDGSVKGTAKVADIHLSKDVPQFKRKSDTRAEADADGTTYKLSGGYNPSAPDIVVWRRANGRLEVITGRHRLAHAKACGLEVIGARVYDEDAAHDAMWAKLYDVEANILDRTANVQDIAYFFRNSDMTEAEAEARGLMQKAENGEVTATGRMGITIARRTCEEVFTRFMNGALSRDQAYFIATLGADEKGQELAAQLFAQGKKMDWVKAYVREAESARAMSEVPMQFDLFGNDEQWAKDAAKVADYVAKARRQTKDKLDILSKAGKLKDKQTAAKELGVTLKTRSDVAKTQQRLILLDAALERMDSALNLGERAAAWDGKSAVSLDELQQEVARNSRISYSASRASALQVQPTSKKDTVRRMELFSHGLSDADFRALEDKEKAKLANKGLDEVYAKAEEVQEEFRSLVEHVGKKLGLRVKPRKSLKGRARALSKTISDNVGDAGQLLDVCGGTLIFTERDDFAAAVEEIKRSGVKIARIKNGYLDFDPYGYADIKVNVQMPNGFIGEIILIEDVMLELKDGLGHKIYEGGRALEAELEKNENNAKYGDERRELVRGLVNALQRWSTALYTREGEAAREQAKADAVLAYQRLRYWAYSRVASSEGSGRVPLATEGEGIYSDGSKYSSPVSLSSRTWYVIPLLEEAQAASPSPRVQNLTRSASDAFNNIADSMVSTDSVNVNNKITFSSVRLTAEERGIIDKAKADGTYMLAPNGKPTNLTERQWAQVRTQAFKAWFGDWENDPATASKVLDENGEPLVVYHFTDGNFTAFDPAKARANSDVQAMFFMDNAEDWQDMGERKMACFLNIRKPVEKPRVDARKNEAGRLKREELMAQGYDGTFLTEDGATEWAAFYPEQIKSATDNRGAFDANDARITFSVIGSRAKTWAKYKDKAFKGRDDGMPRAELDASRAELSPQLRNILEKATWVQSVFRKERYAALTKDMKLGDALVYDELFDAYPQLRDYTLRFERKPLGSYQALFSPSEKAILLNLPHAYNVKSVLLHEIQHAIQSIEGFATGAHGSTAWFDARNELSERRNGNGREEFINPYPELIGTLEKALAAKDNVALFDMYLESYRRRRMFVFSAPEVVELATSVDSETWLRDYATPVLPAAPTEQEMRLAIEELHAKKPRMTEARKKAYSELKGKTKGLSRTLARYRHDNAAMYELSAGEIEARAVQRRLNMTAAERAASPFNAALQHPEEAVAILTPTFDEVAAIAESPSEAGKIVVCKTLEDYETWAAGGAPGSFNLSFSTTSLAALRDVMGTNLKEEAMQRLERSVKQSLHRWRSAFSGRGEKVSHDKLAQEMGKLMATAMGVYRSLPAGYRVRLDPMLRKGAVFARMVEEGRVLSYGQIKPEERAALTKRVEESLRKRYPEFYTDSPEWTLKSKEAWEAAQKEATAAVGREEMVRMYEEIAEEAVGAVRRYLKDEELRKLDRFLEALQPRKDSHSRRFRRSNIGVATHDKVVHLAELMEMTPEEQQERLEQLEAEIKAAEAEGNEADGLELGEEYGSVLAFGALRARGYEDIRAARASLVSLVAQSATPWKRKLEREANKAKAIRQRVIRAIGSPDEMRKKEIVEKERNSFWTKLRNLPAYTMSMTQLFDSMTAIPGLGGWAAESCASVVAGHKALISRQNDLYYGMQKFMAEELGLDTETKRNDFMALLKKNETTSITPQADMVVYDERIPYALATEWAMMTPKDRQIAREAWETTNEGMQPLPEAAVATLREQLAQAKPGANVHVRVEYRSDKVKQKLTLSRDQALDIVLRCEQEGYQYNADIHGYTPEVLQQLRDYCGEKVMKLGYFMRERFNRSGVAQAFEAREGVPFPAEENYWPGNFDLTSKGDKGKNALDSSGAGAGTRYGMTKTRVKHNLTFDLTMGATNSFMAGMAMADNYVCFGGLTQQWRSLLTNDAFSRRLREYMGEARFSALKDGLNMLDNQGIMEAYAQRAMSSLVSRVQAAHAPSVLAGSLTTMFKQVSAVLHGSAYPGIGAVRLIGQLLADRVGGGRMTYGKMMQEPIFAERRRRANKQAWEEMLTLGADVKWSRLVAWSRCGMNTLERVDTASNCVSMTALYNVLWKQAEQSAQEAGTPLDEAATHEACMRAVELTLEEAAMPLVKSQRSLLQACGGQGVWGNLNMYMTGEVLNKVGLVVSKWHKAGGRWKGLRAALPFLVTMSASQQMLCMVIDLLRGKSPDDEDEWLMWLACNFATAVTGGGLLNGAPLIGDFVSAMTGGYARTDTLADVLGMDFVNYGVRVVKMAADDKEHSASEWGIGLGNLLRVAPSGLGLFGGGAYSTIQWVSTGTGLLQSANAAYNIVRPGFDYARNRERAERKAKRKRKEETVIPRL